MPAPSKKPIRIVCTSDTHTATPKLPSGDILIHAGDLSNNGTFPELQRQINWLASRRHECKVVISGNHDLLLDPSCYRRHKDLCAPPYAWQRKSDLQWGDAQYLEASSSTLSIRGREIKVFGKPHTPRQGNWAFQYLRLLPLPVSSTSAHPLFRRETEKPAEHIRRVARESRQPQRGITSPPPPPRSSTSATGGSPIEVSPTEAQKTWHHAIPTSTAVLITHGPSLGHLDAAQGCPSLLLDLWRAKPRLHIHGHVYAARAPKCWIGGSCSGAMIRFAWGGEACVAWGCCALCWLCGRGSGGCARCMGRGGRGGRWLLMRRGREMRGGGLRLWRCRLEVCGCMFVLRRCLWKEEQGRRAYVLRTLD